MTRTETITYEVRNRVGTLIATADSRKLAIKTIARIRKDWGWEGLSVEEVQTVAVSKTVYRQRARVQAPVARVAA